LNRTFAFAKVYGRDKAIPEAEKLNLTNSNYFHELLGYLYADTDFDKAIYHYEQAMGLTKSKIERQTLTKAIERLKEQNSR
jgi:RNA polymerase sigma-70 factor (ECF subfamily)